MINFSFNTQTMMLKDSNGNLNLDFFNKNFKEKGFYIKDEEYPQYNYLNIGGNVIYQLQHIESSFYQSNILLFNHLFFNYVKENPNETKIDLVLIGGGGLHELPAINAAIQSVKDKKIDVDLYVIDIFFWPRHQYYPNDKYRIKYDLPSDTNKINSIKLIKGDFFNLLSNNELKDSKNLILYFSRCIFYNEIKYHFSSENKYLNDLVSCLKKFNNATFAIATVLKGTDNSKKFNEKIFEELKKNFTLDGVIKDKCTSLITRGLNYFYKSCIPSNPTNDVRDWTINDKVVHKKFGNGVVINISDNGDILEINFENYGIKKIDAKHQSLNKMC